MLSEDFVFFLWLSDLTWMQEIWMQLVNLSLTSSREVQKNLDLNRMAVKNPGLCLTSVICKNKTKKKKIHTFIYYFCFVFHIWKSKLTVAH